MRDILQRKYANYVLKPFLKWYLKKDRTSKVNGLTLNVKTGVFHPAYFFSSTFFSEFITQLDLKNKTFLDVGCGSGILALMAYNKGGRVTALDISWQAVQNTKDNFRLNFINIEDDFEVIQSDLFGSLQKQKFDVIAINPPYFFKAPSNEGEYAWNCGENGEYFYELFGELQKVCHKGTEVYMILAENCDIGRISKLAANSNIQLELADQRKIKWEHNYIYKLNISKV
ncbi:MAG: methyltransferase [Bacteroidota bacterium]|nr:methyltransferase [Bacteroidota bacterium]